MSVKQRIMSRVKFCLRQITVEPLLFLFTIASALLVICSKALIYHKVCISHYDPDLCDNVDNGSFPEQEQHVQSEASFWYLTETYCYEVPSLVTSFCYGSLSDKYGRRLALVIPITGQLISCMIYILNATFIHFSVVAILPGPLLSGLFGGWSSFNIGAFGVLSDITSPQQRTTRMSIAESVVYISAAMGYSFSGFILDKTSYKFAFYLAYGLSIVSLAYVFLQIKHHRDRILNKSSSYCDASLLTTSFWVLRKKRPDRKRTYILVILLTACLVIISNIGKCVFAPCFCQVIRNFILRVLCTHSFERIFPFNRFNPHVFLFKENLC